MQMLMIYERNIIIVKDYVSRSREDSKITFVISHSVLPYLVRDNLILAQLINLPYDRLSRSLFRLPVLKCQRHREFNLGRVKKIPRVKAKREREKRKDYPNNGSPNKDLANFTELYNSDVN